MEFIENDACPIASCKSKRIYIHDEDSELAKKIADAWGNKQTCPIAQCMDCSTIWEPWPDKTPADCVERQQCDNCAYRAGSRESGDPYGRAHLKDMAKSAADEFGTTPGTNWFCCHKGVPIKLTGGYIEFDYSGTDIKPTDQTCAGFLKAMWAHQDKQNGDKA